MKPASVRQRRWRKGLKEKKDYEEYLKSMRADMRDKKSKSF